MKSIAVLMYHAVAGPADLAQADPHYAIRLARFRRHLQLMKQEGRAVCSVRDLLQADLPAPAGPPVAVTFDDGHHSNLAAMEVLLEHGGRADFFVNPGNIGRPHFLSWDELRRMSDQGMSIQSHGYHHLLLNALTPPEVLRELHESKQCLEEHLGREVSLFAPPGGRMPRELLPLARQAGYTAVCTSRPGRWHMHRDDDVPRFAVLSSTPDEQLRRWITGARGEIVWQACRHGLLAVLKKALGNRAYETLRARLLRVSPDSQKNEPPQG